MAVACLVATVAVAGVVYLRVPVYYTTQTQLVVLSPSSREDSNGDSVQFNPYLTAGDGPSQVMASALQRVAVSPGFEVALRNQGVTTEYSVAVATSGGGVVLEVVTVGLDPQVTLKDLNTVSTFLTETLEKQQIDAGSPENQLLTMRDLVGPSEPEALPGDRMKLAGIAGVLGLVLTALMLTVLATRTRRRPVTLPPATTAPDAESAEPGREDTSATTVTPVSGLTTSSDDSRNLGRRRTDRAPRRADDPQRRADDPQRRADDSQRRADDRSRRPDEPVRAADRNGDVRDSRDRAFPDRGVVPADRAVRGDRGDRGVPGVPGHPGPGLPGHQGSAHRAADPDATTVMPKVSSEAASGRNGPKWPDQQPPDTGR